MSGGVGTAAAEAIAALGDADQALAELEQLGLFEDPGAEERGALDQPSPLSQVHPLADLVAKRGKGRPPGAQNKTTKAFRRFFLQQHRHPVLVMGECYSMATSDLAARIGIAEPDAGMLYDLFKLQMHMAEVAAGFVAQKMPQAVEVDAHADFTLRLGGGVSLPAPGRVAEISDAIEGQSRVVLPPKSDGGSRTDG